MQRQRVVVVGGGFGGLATVAGLRDAAADITLIDRANHHLFQPLLYQVATAALSATDIATATRAILRKQDNVTVVLGEVTGIDTGGRAVTLADAPPVPYDYLVLATGSDYSFFGHAEWAEHSFVLKTLEDAAEIRNRLLGAFELAEKASDPAEVRRLLTFVVVGGGPTGVELAGTIAELARATLARDFRHIDPSSARVVLCEAGPALLPAFPERLSQYARRALATLGVDVLTGAEVKNVDAGGITAGDVHIPAASILWAAGTRARPAARWLGVEPSRHGGITVAADCSVPGLDGVFAIGDLASQAGPSGKPLPGLAAVAKQQGQYLGRLLAARIAGRPAIGPFRYRDLGTMAIIGRSHAVADMPWGKLTGFFAWLLWSLVHLVLLVSFRNRFAVYYNWVWHWLTYARGARLITRLRRIDRPTGVG